MSGLKYHNSNFEGKIRLSAKGKAEIQWWINNMNKSCHHISITNPDITTYTNASLTGWGITDDISSSRGLWYKTKFEHINVLELKTIKIEIYTYCKKISYMSVLCVIMPQI